MNKKGQAALEFLSTYGFAFLIILVMVGALAYFGVLNPQKFLPDRCLLGTEFECRDWQITTVVGGDFTVNLVVGNNLGQSVRIAYPIPTAAEMPQFGADGAAQPCTILDIAGAAPGPTPATIPSGAPFTLQCTFGGLADSLPPSGEKVKVNLEFTWQELGGAFDHITQGEVFTQVQ